MTSNVTLAGCPAVLEPSPSASNGELPLPGGADRDSLRQAVAASRSWRGVLRQFGLTAPRAGRMLRAACDEWGIDYSHFRSRTWTDDQLRGALSSSKSWADVTAALGYAVDSGSARASVRKHAARLGLDLAALAKPDLTTRAAPLGTGAADLRFLREAGAYLVAAACALYGYRISWP